MTICKDCERELETITEDNPCDECGYIHDSAAPDVFEELDFNNELSRTYEPDFEYEVNEDVP